MRDRLVSVFAIFKLLFAGQHRFLAPWALGVIVHIGLVPLYGADLRYYREMAQVALSGGNPFIHRFADFPAQDAHL